MSKFFVYVKNFVFKNPDKILTIRCLILSAFMRIVLKFTHISKLKKYLGTAGEESARGTYGIEHVKKLAKISTRVNRVAQRTPWESKCFVRALVAQNLLTGYGFSSTIYLGVGTKEKEGMVAHAWIRTGDYYITGGNGAEYAVVAKFARCPKKSIAAVADKAVL